MSGPAVPSVADRFDWDRIHARLDEGGSRLQRALHPDPEQLQRIFRQRAAKLAARGRPAAADQRCLVLFEVSGRALALDIGEVAEVAALPHVTPEPGAAPEVRGLFDVRGRVRLLLDLHALLSLPGDPGEPAYGILLRRGDARVAVAADGLTGVEDVPAADLRALPDPSPPRRARALTADGALVLDAQGLLACLETALTGSATDPGGAT